MSATIQLLTVGSPLHSGKEIDGVYTVPAFVGSYNKMSYTGFCAKGKDDFQWITLKVDELLEPVEDFVDLVQIQFKSGGETYTTPTVNLPQFVVVKAIFDLIKSRQGPS